LPTKKVKLVIDRFEGDMVVLVNDITIVIPRFLLPMEAKEGDVVFVELEVDSKETEELKKDVKDKLNRIKKKKDKGDIWL